MNPSLKSKSFWKIQKLMEQVTELNEKKIEVPFIAICETWLKPHIMDAQVNIVNYNVFRGDRSNSNNGGVLLYISKDIVIDEYDSYDDDTCNAVICLSIKSKCIVACLYRPPGSDKKCFSNALSFISSFIKLHNKLDKFSVLLFGDFNFPRVSWDNFSSCTQSVIDADFVSFLDDNFLTQYINENTRGNNILDLFFTNDPNFVQLVTVKDINISDHYLVQIFTSFFTKLCSDTDHCNSVQQDLSLNFRKFNLNSSNFDAINSEFANLDWGWVQECEIESFPSIFNNIVFSALEKHSKCYSGNNKTDRINSFKRNRNILNRKIRKYKKILNNSNCNHLRKESLLKKIADLEASKNKSFFDERIFEENKATNKIKTNPKYFFSYAKRFKHTPSTPNILIDDQNNTITDQTEIANLLQNQFKGVFSKPCQSNSNSSHIVTNNRNHPTITHPLPELNITCSDIIKAIDEIKPTSSCASCDIPAKVLKNCKNTLCLPLKVFWERSFEVGQIPKSLKKQVIIPLHKKGKKTMVQNYRPVSLTPHIAKIPERVIRKKVVNYLELNLLINQNQHGFRQQRSCATQLLSHTNSILCNLIAEDETDSIYLDYSKAFDKIDHQILIKKLEYYKISGKYLKWITNFLKDRSQTVYVNNTYSYSTPVVSGVPQGSVLGPVLFILFINDLPNNLENCSVLTFADDTKIVSKIGSEADSQNLQTNLNKIVDWSKNNNMELNVNKFELISHKYNKENDNLISFQSLPYHNQFTSYYASNDIVISPSSCVRDLGLFIDDSLTWDKHISTIVQKSKQICGWLCSVFYTRNSYVMLTLFKSLVRSRLEYCCEIWDPHLLKDIRRIEQVQRSFTDRIQGLKNLDYWNRLKTLKIRSLQRRREKTTILHTWKILYGIYPNDINLEFYEHTRTKSIKAKVKPLPKVGGKTLTSGKTLTLYDNSFIIKSAKLWNILPPKLSNINDFNKFKVELDKFLNDIPDEPPLPNYPFRNKNSLIEHCGICG